MHNLPPEQNGKMQKGSVFALIEFFLLRFC